MVGSLVRGSGGGSGGSGGGGGSGDCGGRGNGGKGSGGGGGGSFCFVPKSPPNGLSLGSPRCPPWKDPLQAFPGWRPNPRTISSMFNECSSLSKSIIVVLTFSYLCSHLLQAVNVDTIIDLRNKIFGRKICNLTRHIFIHTQENTVRTLFLLHASHWNNGSVHAALLSVRVSATAKDRDNKSHAVLLYRFEKTQGRGGSHKRQSTRFGDPRT